jgi:hypothetical protein
VGERGGAAAYRYLLQATNPTCQATPEFWLVSGLTSW